MNDKQRATPGDMIYNEVYRQIKALKLDHSTADSHAKEAVDDYKKGKRGAGKRQWINKLISYHVGKAKKVGVKKK